MWKCELFCIIVIFVDPFENVKEKANLNGFKNEIL